MPAHIEYEFEQVPVTMPNGATLYCSGKFNVSYTMQRAEPDVGIMSPYPEFEIDDDWVTVTAFDKDSLGEDDMTIRLPWLPSLRPDKFDPLGQIWKDQKDHISEEIMERDCD